MARLSRNALYVFFVTGLGVAAATANDAPGDADNPAATGQAVGQAYINPKTRKLESPPPGFTPASAHSKALLNKLSRSEEGLRTRRLPNGTLLLDLQDRFQNMLVVQTNGNGELVMSCTDSASVLEHALEGGNCPAQTREGGAP